MNKSEIPQAQKGVLGALMDDHRKVKQMFRQFESEKDQGKRMDLVASACTELTIHAKIEEELFYPFLRDQSPDVFGDLLNEALVEHASGKELISQLKDSTPDDDELYEAKFTVLGEYMNHHIKEEEGELFPKVISKKIDLRELKDELEQRKQELKQELSADA